MPNNNPNKITRPAHAQDVAPQNDNTGGNRAKQVQEQLKTTTAIPETTPETDPETEARVAEFKRNLEKARAMPKAAPAPVPDISDNDNTGLPALPESTRSPFFMPPPMENQTQQHGIVFSGQRVAIVHTTGEYMIGADGDILPIGTKLVVTGSDLARVRFAEGRPAEYIVYDPEHPELYTPREDLLPPPPARGQDVWRENYYLYCCDPDTQELYTLYHGGVWGKAASARLISQTYNKTLTYPDARPVIKLGARLHPAKGTYLAFYSPVFTVIDWVHEADGTPV